MALYIIGIGGTGAKCLESITHVAALGLFDRQPIKTLFVDADETNGNLDRARTSLNLYSKCQEALQNDGSAIAWMQTPIQSFGMWSPFVQNEHKNLATFFNYNTLKQNNPELGDLFDVLYTKEERDAHLDVGFRGRPAIGSAVMSQIDLDDLDQEPWGTFLQQIRLDAGSGQAPKIFLCGSMFGGTGASGLPTIGRLIAKKLEKLGVRDRVKIACLFMLPYFGFLPPSGEDPKGVYARSEQFLLNTEAALRYYLTQAQPFDSVYLLGNQNLSQVQFSIGKQTQRNAPHFLELYAGLAARQFLLNSPQSGQSLTLDSKTVVLMSRNSTGRLMWTDLPESAIVKAHFANATRFAYAWLFNLSIDLQEAKQQGVAQFQKMAPWFDRFFRPSLGAINRLWSQKNEDLPDFTDPQQQNEIAMVSAWCKDYLSWLSELHDCEGETIELFLSREFRNLDRPTRIDDLSALIVQDSRDRTRQSQDRISDLKIQLLNHRSDANVGTVGLAKAFYQLCRL
jgi:hypothetical protein